MNVQQTDRKRFLSHLHAVEDKFPLRFLGVLPRGTAAHVSEENAVDLLAERRRMFPRKTPSTCWRNGAKGSRS